LWIRAVLTAYLDYNESDAREASNKFYGFGPGLFALDGVAWEQMLGKVAGSNVYALLSSLREKGGAVPKYIPSWPWKTKRK